MRALKCAGELSVVRRAVQFSARVRGSRLWDFWRRHFRLRAITPPLPFLGSGRRVLCCQFPCASPHLLPCCASACATSCHCGPLRMLAAASRAETHHFPSNGARYVRPCGCIESLRDAHVLRLVHHGRAVALCVCALHSPFASQTKLQTLCPACMPYRPSQLPMGFLLGAPLAGWPPTPENNKKT